MKTSSIIIRNTMRGAMYGGMLGVTASQFLEIQAANAISGGFSLVAPMSNVNNSCHTNITLTTEDACSFGNFTNNIIATSATLRIAASVGGFLLGALVGLSYGVGAAAKNLASSENISPQPVSNTTKNNNASNFISSSSSSLYGSVDRRPVADPAGERLNQDLEAYVTPSISMNGSVNP